MSDTELKALRFFTELYRAGSVSEAARRMEISQPTGSGLLAKLRARFGDPLFVQTGAGMRPTPRAETIATPLHEALRLIDRTLSGAQHFDPVTSERSFHLAMTDISQLTLLPRLREKLRREAPAITLTVTDLDAHTPAMLETGASELAIGFITGIGPGFMQQSLFSQSYLCLAGVHHPRLRGEMTMENYLAEDHLLVSAPGTGHHLIDQLLARRHTPRHIAMSVPSFLGVGHIVAHTDLIATVPAVMAHELDAEQTCRSYALPFAVPEFAVRQYWHARSQQDAGHGWLRGVIAEIFHAATPPMN